MSRTKKSSRRSSSHHFDTVGARAMIDRQRVETRYVDDQVAVGRSPKVTGQARDDVPVRVHIVGRAIAVDVDQPVKQSKGNFKHHGHAAGEGQAVRIIDTVNRRARRCWPARPS